MRNGYQLELIKRAINSHNDNCRKIKFFILEEFLSVLKLPFLGNVSSLFEKRVQKLTQLTYNKVKLVYKPVLDWNLKTKHSTLIKVVVLAILTASVKEAILDKHLGI